MNQVRKYALAYLGRKIDLDDFLDWLADATSPAVDLGLKADEKSLAGEIELPVAELTGGHISEERFRVLLRAMVSDTNFYLSADLGKAQPWQAAASGSVTVTVEPLEVCA